MTSRFAPRNKRDQMQRDVGIQVNIDQNRNKYVAVYVPKWFFWTCTCIVGLTSVYLATDYAVSRYAPRWIVDPQTLDDMGIDGIALFRRHDRNNDGTLSLEEFEPIAHQILDINDTYVYEDIIEDWDDVLTVEAHFDPVKLDTMTKDFEQEMGSLDSLLGLKSWKKASSEWKNFGASHFYGFLPPDTYMQESLGEVYYIVEPVSDYGGAQLSSNRYMPMKLDSIQDIIIHRLLLMFHPRPFVYSRFKPQGTVATVRAFNDKYLHIVFRTHAEFQLNEPPFFPFWFTPAQFMGDLIIHRDATKVIYFRANVPNNNLLNVDMEWLNVPKDKENMEVDIGYVPQMELRSTRASVGAFHGGEDQRDKPLLPTDDYEQSIEAIQWTKEISQVEAQHRLEVKMYPFKEVPYYNFTEAFNMAKEHNKPVHSILLWGALDDQSC